MLYSIPGVGFVMGVVEAGNLTKEAISEMKPQNTIAIGADHGGFEQKEVLKKWLKSNGYYIIDCGTDDYEPSVDYPDFAQVVAEKIVTGEATRGILICGTGLGISIAANKVAGIRAVPVTSVEFARLSREHNNANVLCLSGRYVDEDTNKEIVRTFLNTEFEGGRHQGRLDKIEEV